MTSIARRSLPGQRPGPLIADDCPSYDTIKIQSVMLGYVVAEGHGEETARDLIDMYCFEHGGDRAEVGAAFLDLIGRAILGVDEGKAVRFEKRHVAQAAVAGYVGTEGHWDETVIGLSEKLSPGLSDGSVEIAIRDLVGAGLLEIEGGKVVQATTENE